MKSSGEMGYVAGFSIFASIYMSTKGYLKSVSKFYLSISNAFALGHNKNIMDKTPFPCYNRTI